nr:MAG: hypothetical protein DIU78_11445 [Pseudomonadota bacterium]
MRLSATRGALGFELYEPVDIGPLTIAALELSLPGLKFPIDLSGGVPKFRHRRGDLEHARVRLDLDRGERWLVPIAAELFPEGSRRVTLFPVPGGLGVGVLGTGRAVAFDLLWVPAQADARFVVANARGVGFDVPALGAALRMLDTAAGKLGLRRGRVITVPDVGHKLGRALLPAVGVRAPSARRVRLGALEVRGRAVEVVLDAAIAPPELGAAAARALDLASLVVEADDALAAGDVDRARAGYVSALESAPRHPELVQLVAEIDARVGARAEAALGLLVESVPATQAGLVGAELLARRGDLHGAREAVEHAARREPFAPLSALLWVRLAELERDPPARAHALDRAVAQAPGLAEARWARFAARLARGDVDGALSDAEHLEAIARGARARHDVCRMAASRLLEAGYERAAGRLYERALRYLPDDAVATAGLARALVLAGRSERALPLFERAVELGERKGAVSDEALIDLARLLAEHVGDLPQAIARLRAVPPASSRRVEALWLEGRYRARLGDRVGATLAFARMREAIELSSEPASEWVPWLVEAADNALGVDEDAAAAERHLATALRLAPNDAALGARYREVAERVAQATRRS